MSQLSTPTQFWLAVTTKERFKQYDILKLFLNGRFLFASKKFLSIASSYFIMLHHHRLISFAIINILSIHSHSITINFQSSSNRTILRKIAHHIIDISCRQNNDCGLNAICLNEKCQCFQGYIPTEESMVGCSILPCRVDNDCLRFIGTKCSQDENRCICAGELDSNSQTCKQSIRRMIIPVIIVGTFMLLANFILVGACIVSRTNRNKMQNLETKTDAENLSLNDEDSLSINNIEQIELQSIPNFFDPI